MFSAKKKYATIIKKEEIKPKEQKEEQKEQKEREEEQKVKVGKLWQKCPDCDEALYKEEVKQNMYVCPNCGHYFKMSAKRRVKQLIDLDTFDEKYSNYFTTDPLKFEGYMEKIERYQKKTSMKDAVIVGTGKMNGIEICLAVMDFNFGGGSMGSVVGEKITLAIEEGIEKEIPVVVVATSGGARMQEGILSLMQMAKTSAALEKLRSKGIPFISVPVNPTSGGVTASFAMLGDLIISEPKALIAFAGARVIEQTIKQKLPEGFQRAEFLLEHGMVDIICERKDLKDKLTQVIDILYVREETDNGSVS